MTRAGTGTQLRTASADVVTRVIRTAAEERAIERDWAGEREAWRQLRRKASTEMTPGVVEADRRIHAVIRASARRHGWEAVEALESLDELVAAAKPDAPDGESRARREHFHDLLGWIFGDSPHPARVMRRLYALAYHQRPDLLAYMTMADLGLVLGETAAAFSWRLQILLPGLQSRSQKRRGTKTAYAAAQRGNKNRRKGEQRKRREQQRKKQNYEYN